MIAVNHLEIHVAHACNLTCASCSHYSNHGHAGFVSLADATAWMAAWNQRLDLRTISLLGGEPTLHPELPAFVRLAREMWPNAHVRLVTNGFFLARHPSLPIVLRAIGNASLNVSIHHPDPSYRARVAPIVELVRDWQRRYALPHVTIVDAYKYWTKRYHGHGAQMRPFEDNRPRDSWQRCPAKRCPQLFEGTIWKCAPLAYLRMQRAKYQLHESWDPYLRYQPLAPAATDEEVRRFFLTEDEAFCGMCSATLDPLALPNPLVRPTDSLLPS